MLMRTRRAASLLFVVALSAIACVGSTRHPGRIQFRHQGETIYITSSSFRKVPFLEISVASPRMTFIYLHGGPAISTLSTFTDFELYLAQRFSARVIKPAYYGSLERSPETHPVSFEWEPTGPKEVNARRITAAYRSQRAGMPQAVSEIRSFVNRWDSDKTVIVGDSFGAMLAALACQGELRSSLVLVAPQLMTDEEAWEGAEAGTYVPAVPTQDLVLEIESGRNIAPEIFDTPQKSAAFRKAWSLAYYEPWQSSDLGTLLRGVKGRITVIAGLKDRVGMVTGREVERLRANAPDSTRLCIDPDLAHEYPTATAFSRACFEEAVLNRGEALMKTGKNRDSFQIDASGTE